MTIKVLSDTALVIEVAAAPGPTTLRKVRQVAQFLSRDPELGAQEVVPGLNAVALHLRPESDVFRARERLEEVLGVGSKRVTGRLSSRRRVLPVVYGGEAGPDLASMAARLGLTEREVIKRHAKVTYLVSALGFAPGFPYLLGLDPVLACPRRETPRLRVPAGSVGIGGTQTGVYPQELPGGWNLIGRTAQRLFDPDAADPSWLQVGDRVRFKPVTALPTADSDPVRAPTVPGEATSSSGGRLEVLAGGVQTLVQDLGRPGFQSMGVAEGGALNSRALAVANLLVGNPAGAPGLEWALKGPVLRFSEASLVAITGMEVAGRPVGLPFPVQAGEVLDLSKLPRGGRGYLAVAGGIAVPLKLGSASTQVAAGFGGFQGRELRTGDWLATGSVPVPEVRTGWSLASGLRGLPRETLTEIRVLPGPEAAGFGPAAWTEFLAAEYRLSPDSNRMGFRLEGPKVTPLAADEMVSQPVALGTVQIPPSGQPLVLMADRQSLGGYPRFAGVISADIPVLASVPLGGEVRFVAVDLAEAQEARHRARRDLGLLAAGLRYRLIRPR